jgi:GGDEF domain-containing protein
MKISEAVKVARLLKNGIHRKGKDAISSLIRASLTDPLTGAYNRNFVSFKKDKNAQFIDVCDFKRINDVFGYHAGDIILRRIVERLGKKSVIRWGGDEFIYFGKGNARDLLKGMVVFDYEDSPVSFHIRDGRIYDSDNVINYFFLKAEKGERK